MTNKLKRSLIRNVGRLQRLFSSSSSDLEPTTASSQQTSAPATPDISLQDEANSMHLTSPPNSPPSTNQEFYRAQLSPTASILPTPLTGGSSAKHEGWTELITFSNLLSNGFASFGPLKEAVGMILAGIDIFETAAQNREDYQSLRSDLNSLFHDLVEFFGASTPPVMTSSVINLARGIERELDMIRRKLGQTGTGTYLNAKVDADKILEHYRRIQALLQRLTFNVNLKILRAFDEQATETRLKYLPISPAAKYNSAESSSLLRSECTQHTRVQVLENLYQWACDNESQKVYWLNGMAGTGKTTIAYSLCQRLGSSKKLAASFFCSRQLPSCRDANRIIPTISYQLSRFSRPFRAAISQTLEEDLDVFNQPILNQFENLIVKPLNQAKDALPIDLVVVIDALDECDGKNKVDQMLNALFLHARDLPVKFFITGRPDAKILDGMRSQQAEGIRAELRLHELGHSTVQEDIKTYLTSKLSSHIDLSETSLNTLVERSGVLFIYAATVVRYIEDDNFSWAGDRLEEILNVSDDWSSDSEQDINRLYTTILKAAFDGSNLNNRAKAKKIKLVLDTVVCAQEPLSVNVMASLLGITTEIVRAALRPLLSILHLSDTGQVVTTLHKSFPDYLLDKSRSGEFHCDGNEHNERLAQLCFQQMKIPDPPFNICNLESSYVLDKDIPDLSVRVKTAISEQLLYACRYWGAHLTSTTDPHNIVHTLFEFLSERLLLWTEAMNLSNHMDDGVKMLHRIQRWSSSTSCLNENIKQLLQDAWRFLTAFSSSPTRSSTPHIYVSSLSFWPDHSPITRYYRKRKPDLITETSTAMNVRRTAPLAIATIKHSIRSLAYSPNGAYIASGSDDEVIRIWDAHTARLTRQLFKGHTDTVFSVAYSPDGAYIASGSDDHTIRIWDVRTGQPTGQPLMGHAGAVNSVAYSPNGTHIVSGSSDGTICTWDVRTGRSVWQAFDSSLTSTVWSVVYSPDGASIVSGSSDNTLHIWDAHTGKLQRQPLEGHTGIVVSVAFSPDGAYVASGSYDKTIRIWDAHDGNQLQQPLKGHTDSVCCVAYSPDGSYIISSSDDKTIRIWDARTGQPIQQHHFKGHTGPISSVTYSPDGEYIVSGSYDHTIRIWDPRTNHLIEQPLEGHTGAVWSITYSPDGACIASGSYDNTIQIWDACTGQPKGQPLEGHTGTIYSVAHSPVSAHVASGSHDKTIRIWNTHTGSQVRKPMKGHTDSVCSVAYSPDGAHLVSGSDDNTICIWNIHTGKPMRQPGHTDSIYSVAYSPNGAYIVSGSNDKTIRIWDARTGQPLHQPLKGHTGAVTSVAYSPDSASIVSGSHDKTVRIWDAKTCQSTRPPLEGHTDFVLSVAYSPNGAYIFSGSSDKTIRIWDTHTCQPIQQLLVGHTSVVYSVAHSPTGAYLASGSDDNTIRIWSVQLGSTMGKRPQTNDYQARIKPGPGPEAQYIQPHVCNLGCETYCPHTTWTLREDGWINSDDSKLLIWVPSDLRGVLLRPQNTISISRHGFLHLDLDCGKIGDNWSENFQPPKSIK